MKVEIWSDIVCPFCYIAKRNFERALGRFEHRAHVAIIWKSFQLNRHLVTTPGKNLDEYLAEIKGCTLSHAREMNNHVTLLAEKAGLEYNLDRAVVANSFNAHRLMHLAEKSGCQDQLAELLFKAYFTDGKNIADRETLVSIGSEAGIEKGKITRVLEGNDFSEQVAEDMSEARQYRIHGVPHFILNGSIAVSGAQDPEVFLDALDKSWKMQDGSEIAEQETPGDGTVCAPGEECEE